MAEVSERAGVNIICSTGFYHETDGVGIPFHWRMRWPELQDRLDPLNDLALTLSHAHWNLTGPQFRPRPSAGRAPHRAARWHGSATTGGGYARARKIMRAGRYTRNDVA
jgi:hypothetical protein